MPRRTRRALFLTAAVAAGLAWRFLPLHLPFFAWKYGGSILWAIALYFLIAAIFPNRKPLSIMLVAALAAVAVEYSRLITIPAWLHFRHTLAGRLLIGNVFSLRNIVAYWTGIAVATFLDRRRG